MGKKRKIKKLTNEIITFDILKFRTDITIKAGYSKPKWVEFCEALLTAGYELQLYEARQTFSKYITVMKNNAKPYKVRFSNHMPIKHREIAGDCDFFVGKTHLGISNKAMALKAVEKHFKEVVSNA